MARPTRGGARARLIGPGRARHTRVHASVRLEKSWVAGLAAVVEPRRACGACAVVRVGCRAWKLHCAFAEHLRAVLAPVGC